MGDEKDARRMPCSRFSDDEDCDAGGDASKMD
jgi:hypothetical protein